MSDPSMLIKATIRYLIAVVFIALALWLCGELISLGLTHHFLFREERLGTLSTAQLVGIGFFAWLFQYFGFTALRGAEAARREASEAPVPFRSGPLWDQRVESGPQASVAPNTLMAPGEPGSTGRFAMRLGQFVALASLFLGVIGIPFTGGMSLLALSIGLPLAFLCFLLGVIATHLRNP